MMSSELISKQEKHFWETISRGISKKLNWAYPIEWTEQKIIELQEDMATVLSELAKENEKIYTLCKFDRTKPILKDKHLTATIRNNLQYKKSGVSRDYTKNKFTFYLSNQNAEVFKKSMILAKPIESSFNVYEDANDSYFIRSFKAELEELADIFEFRAEKIRNNLQIYLIHDDFRIFLEKFEQLHLRHIGVLKKGKLIFANLLLNEIKNLSLEVQVLAEKYSPVKPEGNQPFPFFYIKNNAFGEMIHFYINKGDKLENHQVNFLNTEINAITEKEVMEFYYRIWEAFQKGD